MRNYSVILFQSVSHALLAEKILLQEEISHKLIPVPRSISSNCGVCIRFEKGNLPEDVEKKLHMIQFVICDLYITSC